MPEEKKESFTFSDKIKNSKPANSKSFAKPSSKIGRDGKPKQTLFERTRRDAPFFIAALVALLLLPFLYKYSGQSSEDTALLTPGSEESMFDPERYGFDTALNVEDPDNQIAQLSGRSSLDLIKGWGNKEEEDYGRDDMDFEAAGSYDAEGESSSTRSSSTNIDEEENITNIYKRRARQGTRAAFRRTQIGKLDPASMRRPGGSRLGIQNWGGSIKDAAKRVPSSGPRNAPKPVSLQPLRAAGPARSSFGGGAGVAARKGLDNMGKANAIEALRDSYVKPVDPVRSGGIDLFSDGRSGGSGKLDHNIHIGKGETPWWWDMMKTRMQEEWKKRFERKWGWITFFDDLAKNILKGLINCIVTGDSDGDPDHFLGDINIGGGSGGGKKECCGWSEKKWKGNKDLRDVEFNEDNCKSNIETVARNRGISVKDCPKWKDTTSSGGASVGFFGQRLKCLGISIGGYKGDGTLEEGYGGLECENMPALYQLNTSSLPRKWQKHTYIYVVARNYFPQALKAPLNMKEPRNLLCTQDHVLIGSNNSSGVGANSIKEERTSTEQEVSAEIIAQTKATGKKQTERQDQLQDIYTADPESITHGCVIYVQQGDTFNYENFKNAMVLRFAELATGSKEAWTVDKLKENPEINQLAHDAYLQLDLMFVESFASKNKLAYSKLFESGNRLDGVLPMMYWRFYDAYVRHKKTTHKETGSRINVDNRKLRKFGEDSAKGPKCYFDNLNIECGPEDSRKASVVFSAVSYKGGDPAKKPTASDIVVSAQFRDANGTKGLEQPMIKPDIDSTGYVFNYTFSKLLSTNTFVNTNIVGNKNETTPAGLVGMIRWTATRGDQVVTKDCPLNLSGDGPSPIVDPKPCPNGPQTSRECCEEIYGKQDAANDYKWEGGVCKITPKQQVPPPSGQQVKQFTLFAPGIKCVPNGTTDRKARPDGAMTEQEMCKLFGSPLVGKYNTSGQSCKDLWGFKMDSAKATAFVNRVKEAYNKQNPNLPIKFDKTYPQDSEFIDALNIAQSVGITDVPVAAVCEMGRDFVRMSKDKHVGDRSIVSGSTGTKNEPLVFRNELGAFLAYIHDTSILYPDAYVRVNGQNHCDWRFQPYGMGDGGCAKNGGPKIGKGYAHNNYNGTKYGGKLAAFQNSLTSIMKQTPLRALAGGKDLPHNCGNCKAMNGNNYVKQYNSYSGFAGLLHEETPSINGQGIACEAFLGGGKDATMKVEDALKYIEGICTAGLDYKPVGQGRKDYVQGQSPSTAGGHSSGDEITGQRI